VNAGLIASVHARLLARTKELGEDFNLTLTRYARERFLYRLSISDLREQFWLMRALKANSETTRRRHAAARWPVFT